MMIALRAVTGGIVLVMAVAASYRPGEAAEWSAEPSLAVKGVYNSNLILTSAPHNDTWGVWVSPGLKFAGATENLEINGKAAADFVGYYGGVDQSITNMYFPLSLKYNTERETFGLDGGFIRDNTLMGELRQTGVVLRFTQRNYWNVAPSWTHSLTERLSLQAGYQYASAEYENGQSLGLVNYTTQSGSAGLTYRLTEKDQLQATGILTDFKAPQASNLHSTIYGGDLSWSRDFTESLTGSLSGGARMVASALDSGPSRVEDSQVVWVGRAKIQKKWEDATAAIEASRDVYPSGFGLLVRTSRVGIGMTKDVTERLTLSLDAAVFLAESVASEATTASLPLNRYLTVTPAVRWKMADWWTLDVNYTYSQRDVESLNETAFSNAATIMLTYFPPKWSVGR
jgi:hypothetical protein